MSYSSFSDALKCFADVLSGAPMNSTSRPQARGEEICLKFSNSWTKLSCLAFEYNHQATFFRMSMVSYLYMSRNDAFRSNCLRWTRTSNLGPKIYTAVKRTMREGRQMIDGASSCGCWPFCVGWRNRQRNSTTLPEKCNSDRRMSYSKSGLALKSDFDIIPANCPHSLSALCDCSTYEFYSTEFF